MSAVIPLFLAVDNLPSPPSIALRILSAVREDESSFHRLAEIVTADPALTAQILKIANSSLYGLSKRVDSLSHATALLGTRALSNIALSFVIVKNFEQVPEGSFDLNFFWKRSIVTGVAAELLNTVLKTGLADIFVSGLLQDLGVLAMYLSRPREVERLFDDKRVDGSSLWEAEIKVFGCSHAEIGYLLLDSWSLPESISLPIRHHHASEVPERHGQAARILALADKVSSLYYGTRGNQRSVEIHHELEQEFGVDKVAADELIDAVGAKAREMMELFAIDPGEIKPYSQIIQETNRELQRLNLSYEEVVYELKQAKQNAEKLALELKRANQKLRQLAFRDELTGLYNHRYFQEVLDGELRKIESRHSPLSLLLIDIDYFKAVNDTYGHLVGDHVLRQVGQLMLQLVRRCDTVARYGGEEFGVILPETTMQRTKVIGQRLRRGIEQLEINHPDGGFSVTISLGGASTELASIGLDKTALIDQSDRMLYRAKKNGRNRLELASSTISSNRADCSG